MENLFEYFSREHDLILIDSDIQEIEIIVRGKNPTIGDLAKIIYQDNAKKGFWNESRNVGEMLMLVVSELGEAIEAHRKGKFTEWKRFNELVFNNDISENEAFAQSVKDTFEDELGDAIIRLLDMAGGLNIDIQKHIEKKLAYNKNRPHLHGKKY